MASGERQARAPATRVDEERGITPADFLSGFLSGYRSLAPAPGDRCRPWCAALVVTRSDSWVRVVLRLPAACLIGALVLWSAGPWAAQEPTFRGAVDLVSLDVLVLDHDRQPVHGLTAADFTVLERGRRQDIIAFSEVDVPDRAQVSAPWMQDVAPDVADNNLRTKRFIVLLMDDGGTNIEEGESETGKAIARAVVDGLGPDDVAAVAFTFRGRSQEFTTDRGRLRAAIESFQPRNWPSPDHPCRARSSSSAAVSSTR